ncbi:MAG TPA: alpha/beta fold hydrolase [Polyangiaceae bacterium]|nr:alpha/beta fold hydrolase [Polyangiaceae bacterium]
MSTETYSLFSGSLRATVELRGSAHGRTYFLLHGGAGPASMAPLLDRLARDHRVVAPILPGFSGTDRPAHIRTVSDLALTYLALLDTMQAHEVVLVGNSFGGWLAAEIALRATQRIVGVVFLNTVGIHTGSPARTIVDPTAVPLARRAALSFHDPAQFAGFLGAPEVARYAQENQRALRTYAGEPFMHDPSLYERLAGMRTSSLVIWGESDRIVDMEYGRRFASVMPGSSFVSLPGAGHFPQIEQSEEVARQIQLFGRERAQG